MYGIYLFCLIHAISSPLCRINRRHRMILMLQRILHQISLIGHLVKVLVVINGTSICNCGCRWWSTWITCELICDILWDMWRLWYICGVGYICCWWYICDVGDVCYIYLLFVWMKFKKQIKNVVFSHFAECNGHALGKVTTWEHAWEHALPSAHAITLSKHHRFAECHGLGTRQRSPLCRVSVLSATLGKVATFAECLVGDTRQSATFAECLSQRRSANRVPLPSAWPWHSAKPPSRWRSPSRSLFFVECRIGRVPDKVHSAKRSLPINYLPSALFRVYIGLCRVPEALGKEAESGSAASKNGNHSDLQLF